MRHRVLWTIGLLIVLTTSVAAVDLYHYWQAWAAYETGSRNTAGTPPNYNYWSGFGSVFPWSMTLFAGVWSFVYQNAKHKNCHTRVCWRLGSFPVGDPPYTVCRKHHYEATGTQVTIEHLKVIHHLHKRKRLLDAGYKTKDES
jgi:hypothetical protein